MLILHSNCLTALKVDSLAYKVGSDRSLTVPAHYAAILTLPELPLHCFSALFLAGRRTRHTQTPIDLLSLWENSRRFQKANAAAAAVYCPAFSGAKKLKHAESRFLWLRQFVFRACATDYC
jgi:hypothetical protein